MGLFLGDSWYRAKQENASWSSSHLRGWLSRGWPHSAQPSLIPINLFLWLQVIPLWLPESLTKAHHKKKAHKDMDRIRQPQRKQVAEWLPHGTDLFIEYQKVTFPNLSSPDHYSTPIHYWAISDSYPKIGWNKSEHKLPPECLYFFVKE